MKIQDRSNHFLGTYERLEELKYSEAKKICEKFALKHKIIFDEEGECGFGRECVGFRHGDNWISHNPWKNDPFEKIDSLACEEAYAPEGVNAYHKHDCLAVLGRGEEAVIQLAQWVKAMEGAGEVKIVQFETGAKGIAAIISGVFGHAVFIKSEK